MLTAERDSETAQKAGKVMTMLESSDQTVERRPFDPASFDPEILQGEYQEIANMLLACHCGIKEVRTKLEILSDEMQLQNSRNPIEYIRSRPDACGGQKNPSESHGDRKKPEHDGKSGCSARKKESDAAVRIKAP